MFGFFYVHTMVGLSQRFKNMRYLIFILLVTIAVFSCTNSVNTIEIKNEAGIIVEQYQIDSDSLKTGESRVYDDEGELFDLSNYVAGKLEGKRTLYYKGGAIDTEENYSNDILEGAYKQYHKNGNLMQTGTYTNGVLSGEVISYFENGKIRESVTFESNLENGPFTEYFENGKKQWEGTYRNGDNEFGLLIEYDSLENMIKKMNCDTLGMCRTIWSKEKGDITPSF